MNVKTSVTNIVNREIIAENNEVLPEKLRNIVLGYAKTIGGGSNHSDLILIIDEVGPLSLDEKKILKREIDLIDQKREEAGYLPHLLEMAYEPNHWRMTREQKIQILLFFIDLKVEGIFKKNSVNESLLHLTAKQGMVKVVEALLNEGAELEDSAMQFMGRGNLPQTALAMCVQEFIKKYGEQEQEEDLRQTIHLMMKKGASVEAYNGPISIGEMVIKNSFLFEQSFIDKIYEKMIHWQHPRTSYTLLDAAIESNSLKNLQNLLEKGANPNLFSKRELLNPTMITPLHRAVLLGREQMVPVLLEAGANPNLRAVNAPYSTTWIEFPDRIPLTPYLQAIALYNAKSTSLVQNKETFQMIMQSMEDFAEQRGFALDIRVEQSKELDNEIYNFAGLSDLQNAALMRESRILLPNLEDSKVRIYVQDMQQQPIMQKAIHLLYGNSPQIQDITQPILNVLSAECQFNEKFAVYYGNYQELGGYNAFTQSEIFIQSDGNFYSDRVAETLIHEATHMAAHRIYQQVGKCAPNEDSPFYEAMQEDIEQLKSSSWRQIPAFSRRLFSSVEICYKKESHAEEYLARIPQLALLLVIHNPNISSEDLILKMEEMIPNMFNFFRSEFLPLCNEWATSKSDKGKNSWSSQIAG